MQHPAYTYSSTCVLPVYDEMNTSAFNTNTSDTRYGCLDTALDYVTTFKNR